MLPFPVLCPFRFSIVLFHPLPHQTVREVFPHTAFLLPSQQGIIHLSTKKSVGLRLVVYLSPQFLQTCGSLYHSSPPHLQRKIWDTAEPLRSGKVMMSSPSSLLRAHPPPSRLSAHFVFQLIRLTLLLILLSGTRRASPVDSTSFYPCRR